MFTVRILHEVSRSIDHWSKQTLAVLSAALQSLHWEQRQAGLSPRLTSTIGLSRG
jgi:hypothetical protein